MGMKENSKWAIQVFILSQTKIRLVEHRSNDFTHTKKKDRCTSPIIFNEFLLHLMILSRFFSTNVLRKSYKIADFISWSAEMTKSYKFHNSFHVVAYRIKEKNNNKNTIYWFQCDCITYDFIGTWNEWEKKHKNSRYFFLAFYLLFCSIGLVGNSCCIDAFTLCDRLSYCYFTCLLSIQQAHHLCKCYVQRFIIKRRKSNFFFIYL